MGASRREARGELRWIAVSDRNIETAWFVLRFASSAEISEVLRTSSDREENVIHEYDDLERRSRVIQFFLLPPCLFSHDMDDV